MFMQMNGGQMGGMGGMSFGGMGGGRQGQNPFG